MLVSPYSTQAPLAFSLAMERALSQSCGYPCDLAAALPQEDAAWRTPLVKDSVIVPTAVPEQKMPVPAPQTGLFTRTLSQFVVATKKLFRLETSVDSVPFTYIRVGRNKESKTVTAYFKSAEDAVAFIQKHPSVVRDFQVTSAEDIEIDTIMDEDEVLVIREWLINVGRDASLLVNLLNRPKRKIFSHDKYYGIDITNYLQEELHVSRMALSALNQFGVENENCWNYSLVALGLQGVLDHTYPAEIKDVINAPGAFQTVPAPLAGALVYWYHKEGQFNSCSDSLPPDHHPIHTAIYIGHGWVLTKNGYESNQPYRLQRLSETHLEYGNYVDSHVAYLKLMRR